MIFSEWFDWFLNSLWFLVLILSCDFKLFWLKRRRSVFPVIGSARVVVGVEAELHWIFVMIYLNLLGRLFFSPYWIANLICFFWLRFFLIECSNSKWIIQRIKGVDVVDILFWGCLHSNLMVSDVLQRLHLHIYRR